MSAPTADPNRWGLILGGALVLLLPVFFVNGFHDPFASSKILLTVALGVPALTTAPHRGAQATE